MIIVDLPPGEGAPALRVGVLGTCRVRDTLSALNGSGELRVCEQGLEATHTASEARQALDFVTGKLHIPDDLSLYIFERKHTPSPDALGRLVAGGVDVFVLEISDNLLFSYNGLHLQQNFVTRGLVQPHKGALLTWYRELARHGAARDDTVETALEALRAGGFRSDEAMADLLRGVRMRRQDSEEIAEAVGAMMTAGGGRWLVVSHFEPEDDGAVARKRRALNAELSEMAARFGADFYNPTAMIEAHGRATALDGGGVSLYEYNPAFYPTVGRALIGVTRGAIAGPAPAHGWEPDRPESTPASALGAAAAERSTLADRVDFELRTAPPDSPRRSGSWYKGLLDRLTRRDRRPNGPGGRTTALNARDRVVFELIAGYLPPYGAYGLLGGGGLALLLAASGRDVTAYEPDSARRSALEAGRARLESIGLLERGALTIVDGQGPDGPLADATLGVALGAAPALESLGAFEALLIDPAPVIGGREPVAGREALTRALAAAGYPRHRYYPHAGPTWFSKARGQNRRQRKEQAA